MVAKKSRTRLTPEKRRAAILDAAARLVLSDGLSAATMDAIGQEAAISKALVYSYFSNRIEVLGALLARATKELQHDNPAAVDEATSFEAMIRGTTHAYLNHVAERGLLVQRLSSDPQIVLKVQDFNIRERGITFAYLSRQVAKRYGVTPRFARLATELLMGVTGRAGEMLFRKDAPLELIEAMTLEAIFSAMKQLAAREGILLATRSQAVKRLAARRKTRS